MCHRIWQSFWSRSGSVSTSLYWRSRTSTWESSSHSLRTTSRKLASRESAFTDSAALLFDLFIFILLLFILFFYPSISMFLHGTNGLEKGWMEINLIELYFFFILLKCIWFYCIILLLFFLIIWLKCIWLILLKITYFIFC